MSETTIAAALQKIRTDRGFSVERVAEGLSLEAGTLEAWETGTEDPRITEVSGLLKFLGSDFGDLQSELAPAPRVLGHIFEAIDELGGGG